MKIMSLSIIFLFVVNLLFCNVFSFNLLSPSDRSLRYTNKFISRGCIKMHIGHSHVHEKSIEIIDTRTNGVNNKESGTESINLFGVSVQPQFLFRRPAFRTVFAALVFIISASIRRRFGKYDLFLFAMTFTALTVYDSVRSTVKGWISQMKSFQKNVFKHSTINTKYFFKNENAADKVTLLAVWVNIFLSITKFIGGIRFNSAVLVADAGHSLSDLFSDFITLWAVQIARLPPDDDHPYGHGKFEAIGSLFLSITLIFTGLSVGTWSYDKMRNIILSQFFPNSISGKLSKNIHELILPTWPALVLAAISILSKEWLFRITRRVGNMLNSQILIANAWHHRSDAFSSILSLVSIAVAILFPTLLFVDSAAGILVAGLICTTGFEVMSESIKQLTDTLDEELVSKVKEMTLDVRGVLGVQNVRARSVGSMSLVDMTILTDHQISASKVQEVVERTRWRIMERLPFVTDVIVYASPVETYCPLLTRKSTKTIAALENEVKNVIQKHNLVTDIKKIKVHHANTALLSVESTICVDEDMKVEACKTLAKSIKEDILKSTGIEFSEISLDLA